jgi:hypothetical protein
MARESVTLKDLDDRGQHISARCDACHHVAIVDTIIWEIFAARGLDMTLVGAAARFRCTACGVRGRATLTPCERPPQPHRTGTDIVAAIYFGARSRARRARKGPPPDPLFPSHRVRWWPKR